MSPRTRQRKGRLRTVGRAYGNGGRVTAKANNGGRGSVVAPEAWPIRPIPVRSGSCPSWRRNLWDLSCTQHRDGVGMAVAVWSVSRGGGGRVGGDGARAEVVG